MREKWMVSLHGGHSGEFCDHAQDSLREVIQKAVDVGYHTYGLSEHMPLKDHENERFKKYFTTSKQLVEEFSDRIKLLRAFETEVVPKTQYKERTEKWIDLMKPDFVLGSVHFVHEIWIDYGIDNFEKALDISGSLEQLAIDYYDTITDMVQTSKPDVVGHLDLIKLFGHKYGDVETDNIKKHIDICLETIRSQEAILDINTSALRKGLSQPYPSTWILKRAHSMGIAMCFGDDSHGVEQMGFGMKETRNYLLENGVSTITLPASRNGGFERQEISLN